MSDDRLRDLVARSHEADAPPGFAATVRAARAAGAPTARRSRLHLSAAAVLAAAGLAALVWLAARDRDRPAPSPSLVAPELEVAGPFDQLPSPFPGLVLADLTLDGSGQPTTPDGLPIEDPW